MSKTIVIWKATIKLSAFADIGHSLLFPKGAEILAAREQGSDIGLWFKCHPGATEKERRVIAVLPSGKGWNLPDDSKAEFRHLGVASFENGMLIFNVFEVTGL